jgi:CO/xanthine dehydrogenase Mo-binding subunit
MDIAVRSDGTFTALRARYLTDGGAYSNVPFTPLINVIEGATIATGLYAIENMSYVIDAPLTNKSTNGGYRGVGWGPVHTAREALIDDVARALDMDPVELRLKNFIPDAPYRAPMGQQYDGGSYSASVRRACEIVEYDAFRARQRDAREHGRYLGIGFSPYIEPTGFGVKLAHANLLSDGIHDHARVTVEPDGSVTVSTGLHSHGQGHETTFAQVTADRLGVRLEDVRLVQGDTRTSAFGMGTFASRGAVIGAGLIGNAAGDVRDKLVQLAAHALEASPEDIVVHDGKAFVQGTPAISVTVAELAQTVYYGGSKRPDILDDPALTAVRSYDPGETYTNGVVVAVVDVDAETGMVDLQRVIAVTDCGVMLNPMIVEGQVAGALAQGIGGALYEEIRYSEDGQLETSTLMEYLYPAATEIPSLELHHIETPTPATTEGVKGVGEGGAIAAPVAVLNAVADALHPLGARIDTLPLGPSRVLDAIRAARAEAVAPGP